jgi:hypothetical protein
VRFRVLTFTLRAVLLVVLCGKVAVCDLNEVS